MATVEFLRARQLSSSGEPMLKALAIAARAAGDVVVETTSFRGGSDWLVLFGIGADVNHKARRAHLAAGGHVLHWDLGYIDREKVVGHLRMSIDTDHPQQWLENTPGDSSRLQPLNVALREDADPAGPILLIGLGRKSRAYLRQPQWEQMTFQKLRQRFPGTRIIFRPKGNDELRLACDVDPSTPIKQLLRGASLVVCRHSNVAVDAVIAGVPFEAEDGAAMWLKNRDFTPENRIEFLRRLAWWQWKSTEAAQAWAFAKETACA
jgi:hypothetical protein